MIVLTILLYIVYVLLGLLALLLLLLLIPVHLKAGFDGKLWIRVRYLFLSFALYPRPAGNRDAGSPEGDCGRSRFSAGKGRGSRGGEAA